MKTMLTATIALALAASVVGTASGATRDERAAAPAPRVRTEPPPPLQSFAADSADSLYRAARKALDDGSYGRAADLFQQIADRYPRSRYAADAPYWRAFALYRRGGTDDLRAAATALSRQAAEHPDAATHGDAAALATRIRGELARRGDRSAAESIAVVARGAEQSCPDDEDGMRVAALNALLQMDADQALPILRKVLARRDACSEKLRKKAVFLVAQKQSDESTGILLDVLRNDPSTEVRSDAVFWLGQVSGDRAVAVLDSLVHHTDNEEIQRKAIFALSQTGGDRARDILRGLAQDPAMSDELKAHAIFSLGQLGDGHDNTAYLEALYPKLTSDRLKEQVIQTVAQRDDADARQWVMRLALDPNQSMETRKKALFWAGQGGVSTADLAKTYDTIGSQELKEQLIFVLSQKDDRAATDKLIDIARHDRDRDLRKKAIFWLGQRDDPRVRQLLEELISNDSH